MKILVFDDSPIHREAAVLSLKGHDLTVVGTYDEAQKALCSSTDYSKARKEILPALLQEVGLSIDFDFYGKNRDASKEDKEKFKAAQKKSVEMATTHASFDAVLTDLMVPASKEAQGPVGEKFVGQEMPLGTTIALLALSVGVKNVAVVTDINHHVHPASAAFDCFRKCRNPDINIICTNGVGMLNIDEATGEMVNQEFLESEEGKKKYPHHLFLVRPRGIRGGGKDWGSILQLFIDDKGTQEDLF